jgi:pimeloyl-ACP methyl ester carboxylesterase
MGRHEARRVACKGGVAAGGRGGAPQGAAVSTPMAHAPIRSVDAALGTGVTLACRAAGAQGPRVLLLHGFPEAAFVWDGVMTALADRARCVAPNLRGYAGSSAPDEVEAYHARHLVADLVALIGQLGAPVDLVVAHDWGGALAWSLAAQHPALLHRLLIVNAPHPATFLRELRDDPAQQAASAYMSFLVRPDAERLLADNGFARLWPLLQSPWWTPTAAERAAYEAVWRQGLRGPLNWYRASPLRPARGSDDAVNRVTLPDEAVTVRVPTTVLWGEADQALRPGLLRGLERWVPQLAVQRVADASHWLIHEQPARVVSAIDAALAGGSRG